MPAAPLILGWEEWLALPDLGLPAVKAKVDTGARTSALHASSIEPFGSSAAPMVRFVVHPHPSRSDIAVVCSAPVIGRREVTSSNGDSEHRYVIATAVAIGGRRWPIEVTLTNRETMSYRMLLGRQAIRADMIVEPGTSFRQPRLGYRGYRNLPRRQAVQRPLRIAVVTRRPDAASIGELGAAAAARGHALETIDPDDAVLTFDGAAAGLVVAGREVGHFDAVVPRLGGRGRQAALGAAVVRQIETMGGFALNGADATERAGGAVAVMQVLARAGLGHPPPRILCRADADAFAQADAGDAAGPRGGAGQGARTLRLLVVDHKVVAAAVLRRGRLSAPTERPPVEVRRLARRATRLLKLGLASVDVKLARTGPAIVAVSAAPQLVRLARATGTDVAKPIVAAIEANVRSFALQASGEADSGASPHG